MSTVDGRAVSCYAMTNRLNSELATLFGSDWLSDCVVRFYLDDGDDGVAPRSASRAAGFAEDDAPAHRFLGAPLPAHLLVLYCGSERFQAQIERWHESLATAAPADRFETTAAVWALGHPTPPLRTSTSAPTPPCPDATDTLSTTPTADGGLLCPFLRGQESRSLPCLTGLSLGPQQEAATQTAFPPAATATWRGSVQGRPHTAGPQAATSHGAAMSAARQAHVPPRLPELLVPLGSADELEPSLAALRFLYTRTLPVSYRSVAAAGACQEQKQGPGRPLQPPRSGNNGGHGPLGGLPQAQGHGSVGPPEAARGAPPEAAAMGVRDLLMLRRQGSYLRISGCVGACDAALANTFHDALAALLTSTSTSNISSTGGGSGAAASPPAAPYDPIPPVRELYDSRDLLPCRTTDPGVGAVLDAALQLLLASFRRNPHPHVHASDRGHVPNGTPGLQPDSNRLGYASGGQQQQQSSWGAHRVQQQLGQQQQLQQRQLGTVSGGSSNCSGSGSGRAAGSGSRGDLLVWLMGGDALGIANDPHRCVGEGAMKGEREGGSPALDKGSCGFAWCALCHPPCPRSSGAAMYR